MEPQDLLLTLLTPNVASRERLLRQSRAFVRRRAPRRPPSCLMLEIWVVADVGFWNLAAWALSRALALLHH